jgi:uncharacterized protein YbdZ (MbtH family)
MSDASYKLIVSTQALYSVWPDNIEVPLGWNESEVRGSLVACLDYIGEVWEERNVDAEDGFVVVSNEDDILSVTLADEENPSGWITRSEPGTLGQCLAAIKGAWSGGGPLPVQLRSGPVEE